MSAQAQATAAAATIDVLVELDADFRPDRSRFPEHIRGLFDLSEETKDYLLENGDFLHSLLHMSPERCIDVFGNQAKFDYTRAMYDNREYIVDGYLPWKRVPVPVLKQMMIQLLWRGSTRDGSQREEYTISQTTSSSAPAPN